VRLRSLNLVSNISATGHIVEQVLPDAGVGPDLVEPVDILFSPRPRREAIGTDEQ
jgi:hypothetical protein